jgi:hypothetical protein
MLGAVPHSCDTIVAALWYLATLGIGYIGGRFTTGLRRRPGPPKP